MPEASAVPLIKGYLPVRLSLPTLDGTTEETFFFVKEHQSSGDKKPSCTLFVANAPFVPGVRTRVLLRSLFERYGSVERVTVVENPRQATESSQLSSLSLTWTSSLRLPTFQAPIHHHSEGKFAHVVFASPKDMKKSLRSLGQIMSSSGNAKSSKGHAVPAAAAGLTLDTLELQTLMDETQQMDRRDASSDSDKDDDDDIMASIQPKGILAVAERYRTSCRALSRAALLLECNTVMESFENVEQADRRARETAKSQPDEDGFVTVTYAAQSVGSKQELEQGLGGARRKGTKRSRKKRDTNGAAELKDFYRFQMKEGRKQGLQDLRKRFEEDLAKVKKMKEERRYRPF